MIDVSTSGHYIGDTRALLRELPEGCVRTCITSPPYWGLRSYLPSDHPDKALEIGLEPTPEAFVATMVEVFREVRRVLADDGTLWLNLGDSYAGSRSGPQGTSGEMADRAVAQVRAMRGQTKGIDPKNPRKGAGNNNAPNRIASSNLKHKDLVGIPWMVAFALRTDGWYLRSDIIWHKPNPMPESVTDRPTKAHEYLFLLSKSGRYFYDVDAIREPCEVGDHPRNGVADRDDDQAPGQPRQAGISKRRREGTKQVSMAGGRHASNDGLVLEIVGGAEPTPRRSGNKERKKRVDFGGPQDTGTNQAFGVPWDDKDGRRNKRSVWSICSKPYGESHFAVFPPDLIEPCVLAGSAPGDLVLDPFFGSGTVGQVAEKHMRRWVGFDINDEYEKLQRARTAQRSLPMY